MTGRRVSRPHSAGVRQSKLCDTVHPLRRGGATRHGPHQRRRRTAGDEVRAASGTAGDIVRGRLLDALDEGTQRAADAGLGAARRRQDRAARELDRAPAGRRGRSPGCRSTPPTPTAGGSGAPSSRRSTAPAPARRWRRSPPTRRRRVDRLVSALVDGAGRARRADRARARRLPRGRRGGPRRPRPAPAPPAAGAPARDRDARRPAAAARPAAHAGPADRDPRAGAGADARRGRQMLALAGVSLRRAARPPPVGAHGGLGGRAPARRAVAARPSGPGALRRRLRRRRPRDQRLPDLRGDVAAVARRPPLPAADVDRRRAQRRSRGRADRPRRRPPAPRRARRAAACCSRRSTGAASGTAITRCSASCCRPSCAATSPEQVPELHRRAALVARRPRRRRARRCCTRSRRRPGTSRRGWPASAGSTC